MNSVFKICLIGLTAGLFVSHAQAGISVLDFNSFANGQIIDNEYADDYGVQISSVNYKGSKKDVIGRQVAFDTLKSNTRDPDLEFNNTRNDYNDLSSSYQYTALSLPGYQGQTNPGNVLILQENKRGCGDGVCDRPDDEGTRAAGYFEFTFNSLVDILNIDFFDVEDQAGQDSKFFAIQFFDTDNNEIHKNNYVPTMGDGQFVRQAFSGIDGVKRLVLNMPGSGAIDNLAFRATEEVPAPVALLILALGLAFTIRHKLKRT